MKRLMLAGSLITSRQQPTFSPTHVAVIGWAETAPPQCDIVISSPVIGGGSWFGDSPHNPSTTPDLPVQPFPPVRKRSLSGSDDLGEARLVQDVTAAFRKTVPRRSRIKLRNLGLQVFVDQQQCLQCTAQIAVAARYNLVDDGFTWSGSHRNSSSFPARLNRSAGSVLPMGVT